METVEPLADSLLLIGGALGGLAGFLLVVALPYFAKLTQRRIRRWPNAKELFGVGGLVLVHMSLGAFGAFVVGGSATELRQAVVMGVGWPAILKGAGEGLQALGGESE